MARQFLLTRLLRGVTVDNHKGQHDNRISTHTPLARRDVTNEIEKAIDGHFYSHASCEA